MSLKTMNLNWKKVTKRTGLPKHIIKPILKEYYELSREKGVIHLTNFFNYCKVNNMLDYKLAINKKTSYSYLNELIKNKNIVKGFKQSIIEQEKEV